jgi:DNA-binding response OmpR family regulator
LAGERILVIDDDPQIARVIARTLGAAEFNVTTCGNAAQAAATLRTFEPQLIISDVSMPGADGLSLLRKLRQQSNVPVLLLTVLGSEQDKLAGFQAGADDYMVKPFSTQELVARVRAILKRAASREMPSRLPFGEMELDFGQQQVRVNGNLARLSRLEFGILAHLVSNQGRLVYYDEILVGIWGPAYRGERHLLQVHIQRLRRKLQAAGATREYIRNRWGIGYVAEKPPSDDGDGDGDGDVKDVAMAG